MHTMTRRERLMATLRGEAVDRPAVSFYEIGGWKLDPDNVDDPFNIYSGPGWRELIRLAEEETDLIRMMHPTRTPSPENCRDEFFTTEVYFDPCEGSGEPSSSTFARVSVLPASPARRSPSPGGR